MTSTQRFSFQKKGAAKGGGGGLIRGTRPSLLNHQLLISSGIASFDCLIGDGIPVGSLVLINEDEYGKYAKLMLKYYMAEGIASRQAVFFYNPDVDPDNMINELPAVVDVEEEDSNENEVTDKKMTIAWRYENLKSSLPSLASHLHFGHYFDLSRKMDENLIKNSDVSSFSQEKGVSCDSFQNSIYYDLLNCIKKKLKDGQYFAGQTNSNRNILRIALFHLNSPLWQYDGSNESEKYLLTFLYSLRALLRKAYATCCFTLPFSKYKEDLMYKCIHLSDVAVQLQSFAGTKCEKVVHYKDYHGFFIIQKLAAINCLEAYNPKISNFAFKLRRKKFVIEAFHLPPEMEEPPPGSSCDFESHTKMEKQDQDESSVSSLIKLMKTVC